MRPLKSVERTGTSRRELLRVLVSLTAYLPASWLLAAPTGKSSRTVSIKALGPFLDTLLPDDGTPSATQLDVDAAIKKRMGSSRKLTRLVAMGCAWLDRQAAKTGAENFSALDALQRESIVTTAEQSSARSLPRVFFNVTRELAFQIYYTHTESWKSLGYAGPPQPQGFLDFDRPPIGIA